MKIYYSVAFALLAAAFAMSDKIHSSALEDYGLVPVGGAIIEAEGESKGTRSQEGESVADDQPSSVHTGAYDHSNRFSFVLFVSVLIILVRHSAYHGIATNRIFFFFFLSFSPFFYCQQISLIQVQK